jgi:putative ABC transport system permease protein
VADASHAPESRRPRVRVDWASHVRARLTTLRLSPTREAEIVEELALHLEESSREFMAAGATADEAARMALADFQDGNVLAEKMSVLRQAHVAAPTTLGAPPGHVLSDLWGDVRYAGRVLRRSPGFTVAAVLTLALGIGGTTTVFSFVNAVLLRPLPFPDSSRLVMVEPSDEPATTTPADFLEWRTRSRSFENMAAFTGESFSLTGDGEPEQIHAAAVTASFFDTLGVTAIVGRTFMPAEDQPGSNHVAVIGSSLWRRRFQADAGVVGTVITLNRQPVTVVGVMPDGFDFPRDVAPSNIGRARPIDVWTPIVLQPGDRANAFLRVVGRLRGDVIPSHAQAEMSTVAAQVAEHAPADRRVETVRLMALHERMIRDVRPLLLVLSGAVAFLLVIACSNVANLLLARSTMRQQEVALRAALGAARARLVRQFLMESVVLAVLGGLVGIVLAIGAVSVLRTAIPPGSLPRLGEIVVDRPTLAFTLLTALLTGGLFGLVPALRSTGANVSTTLKTSGPTKTARSGMLHLLVASEVALTFVLLVGAGLLINSFWRLTSIEPGFDPERILTASVTLSEGDYPTSETMTSFSSEVLARLKRAPGVTDVAALNWLPLGGALIRGTFSVEGLHEIPEPASVASKPAVSPDYFRTMGIPLLRGRAFDMRDGAQAPHVAIVSDGLARMLWPGSDPLGKRLTLGFGPPDEQPWVTVVGIVGDVKQTALGDETPPAIYVPLQQAPRPFLLRNLTFVVRTAVDPMIVAPVVRRELHNVAPNLPLRRLQTMRTLLGDSVSEPRFRSTVFALFAAVSVVLVATGILGVLAFAVARRTREIGVRMALGAQRHTVVRHVVGQALRMTALGLAGGVVAAVALTRVLSRFLFDVRASDPPTFVAAAIVLLLAAIVASYVPARRATRVDPLVALRAE